MTEPTTAEITSKELLRRIVNSKDKAAFETLFERYANDVRDSAARFKSNILFAPDDICQEVFIKVWKRPDTFIKYSNSDGRLKRALTRSAENIFLNSIRGKRYRMTQPLPDNAADLYPLEVAPLSTDVKVLEKVLASIDIRDRQLVEDFLSNKRSYKELAEIHGEPSDDSVRQRIRRALEKMKAFLTHMGITSTALANEIRILNMPRPVLRSDFPKIQPRLRHARIIMYAALGLLFVGALVKSVLLIPTSIPDQNQTSNMVTTTTTPTMPPQPASNASNLTTSMLPTPGAIPRSQNNIPSRTERGIGQTSILKKYPTTGMSYTSAGHRVLDQPRVCEVIESCLLKNKRLVIEYYPDSPDDRLPGTLLNSYIPKDVCDGDIVPKELLKPFIDNNAYKLLPVGLSFLSDAWANIARAEGNTETKSIKAEWDSDDARSLTQNLFSDWATIDGFKILQIHVGYTWATIHFTAISAQKQIQQDGDVLLHVLLATPEGDIWGADKIVLKPRRPM